MRLADRSMSLKTRLVTGPCRAKIKLPAEPVVIILNETNHKNPTHRCKLMVDVHRAVSYNHIRKSDIVSKNRSYSEGHPNG